MRAALHFDFCAVGQLLILHPGERDVEPVSDRAFGIEDAGGSILCDSHDAGMAISKARARQGDAVAEPGTATGVNFPRPSFRYAAPGVRISSRPRLRISATARGPVAS